MTELFNLTCTECGHIIVNKIEEDMTKLMQAGHCNWGACQGKLVWKLCQ